MVDLDKSALPFIEKRLETMTVTTISNRVIWFLRRIRTFVPYAAVMIVILMDSRVIALFISLLAVGCISSDSTLSNVETNGLRGRRAYRQYSTRSTTEWKAITTETSSNLNSGMSHENEVGDTKNADGVDGKSDIDGIVDSLVSGSDDSQPSNLNEELDSKIVPKTTIPVTPTTSRSPKTVAPTLEDVMKLGKEEELMMNTLLEEIRKVEELQRQLLNQVNADLQRAS